MSDLDSFDIKQKNNNILKEIKKCKINFNIFNK